MYIICRWKGRKYRVITGYHSSLLLATSDRNPPITSTTLESPSKALRNPLIEHSDGQQETKDMTKGTKGRMN